MKNRPPHERLPYGAVRFTCPICSKAHIVALHEFESDGSFERIRKLCPVWQAKLAIEQEQHEARERFKSAASRFHRSCTQFIIGDAYDNPAT